jgi:hypothetical protein
MKHLIFIFACLLTLVSRGQSVGAPALTPFSATNLQVSAEQTLHLVFPHSIRAVDRGNGQVLAQKVGSAENVLQLKAATKDMVPTNITVFAGDGKLYPFRVGYCERLTETVYVVSEGRDSAMVQMELNEEELYARTLDVIFSPVVLHKQTRNNLLRLQLQGIFAADQLLWLNFAFFNASLLHFVPGSVRFFSTPARSMRSHAIDRRDVKFAYAYPVDVIKAESSCEMVYAFRPFALPSGHRLVMEIVERGSGRRLHLIIAARHLLRPKRLKNFAAPYLNP